MVTSKTGGHRYTETFPIEAGEWVFSAAYCHQKSFAANAHWRDVQNSSASSNRNSATLVRTLTAASRSEGISGFRRFSNSRTSDSFRPFCRTKPSSDFPCFGPHRKPFCEATTSGLPCLSRLLKFLHNLTIFIQAVWPDGFLVFIICQFKYNHEKLPNWIQNSPKLVTIFAKYKINPCKISY